MNGAAVDLAAAPAAPAPMPLPEIVVRATHVGLESVSPIPGQIVPVLKVRSQLVEAQVALQDATIDQLIDALQEIRRARKGFTVAGADKLPGTKRHHP